MQNELEHIDDIFRRGVTEETVEFKPESSWKHIRKRLIQNELLEMNLANINKALFYSVLILLFLLTLSIPFVITDTYRNSNTELSQPKQNKLPSVHPTSGSIVSTANIDSENTGSPDQELTTNESHLESVNNVSDQKTNEVRHFANTDYQPEHVSDFTDNKIHTCGVINFRNSRIDLSTYENKKQEIIYRRNDNHQPSHASDKNLFSNLNSHFSIGIETGSSWIVNEKDQHLITSQPIYDGGLSLRYTGEKYFVSTGIFLNRARSVYNTNYTYDTLLGTDLVTGYEIIKVIDHKGDTVLERNYYSGLHEVYDTLQSTDKVGITSYSTVMDIPVSIGTSIFRYKNLSISACGGIMFRLLISNNQNYPMYSNMNKKVIDFENNPAVVYEPVIYLRAGLLFEYKISNRINLGLNTNYNYKAGYHNSLSQYPLSFIRVGLGVSYNFK